MAEEGGSAAALGAVTAVAAVLLSAFALNALGAWVAAVPIAVIGAGAWLAVRKGGLRALWSFALGVGIMLGVALLLVTLCSIAFSRML